MKSAHLDDLRVEALENRQMMAGDVGAAVTGGGDLVLNGDNQDNQLAVVATEVAGQYEIQGVAGTTINGQQSIVVDGVVDDMRINLRGGDNQILLTGTDSDGDSNNFVVDDVRFTSRSGNDIMVLQDVSVLGQLRARTSSGNDAIGVKYGQVESISVRSGSGNDVMMLWEVEVNGRTDVDLGSDDDAMVSIFSEYQDDVRIRMGSGEDFGTTAADTFDQDLLLDGGNGNDELLEPGAGDLSEVAGTNATVNFEDLSVETGFDYLQEIEDAIEARYNSNFEDIFGAFLD